MSELASDGQYSGAGTDRPAAGVGPSDDMTRDS